MGSAAVPLLRRRQLATALPLLLLGGCATAPPPAPSPAPPLPVPAPVDPRPAAPPAAAPEPATPEGFVSLREFLPPGIDTARTDCTAFLQAALDRHAAVFVPPGVYLLEGRHSPQDGIELRSGQRLQGAGSRSVLRQANNCKNAVSVFHGAGGSASVADNRRDISLRGLRFEGFDNPLWDARVDQWYHCLTIHSATGVLVEDCEFVRFRGDGIYLGSGNVGNLERHNLDVTIRRCRFDGGAGRNRNAISVIDCAGLAIEDCSFKDCSSPPMPGCIDLEPNHPYNVIRDVTIAGCRFDGRSGQHAILVHLHVGKPEQRVENIVVRGNRFEAGLGTRLDTVAFNGAGRHWADAGRTTLSVVDNDFLAPAAAVAVRDARGVVIEGNRFTGSGAVTLGDTSVAALSLIEARVERNQFAGSGNFNGQLVVASARGLQITGNQFERPRRSAAAIAFVGHGTRTSSAQVLVAGNRFERGPAQAAAIAFSAHETDRASFVVRDNSGDPALLPQD